MFSKSHYPSWLLGLSFAQAGALLVFMNFAGTLPLIQADMGFNNTQAGTITAASQFGYVLAVLVLSSLTDFVSARYIIAGGAVWAGLSNLAFAAFAQDFHTAVFFRVLTGLGIAGIYMPGVRFISQRVEPARRGRAVGFFVAAFTVGTSASIALSGGMAASLGWRLALALTSLGPFAGALVIWRTLLTSPPPRISHENNPAPETPPASWVPALLSNRPALLSILAYTAHAWELLGLRSWLPAYLVAVLSLTGMGLEAATRSGSAVAGLATLLGAGATAMVAALSDRTSRTVVIAVVMLTSLVSVLALGVTLAAPWILVAFLSLFAAFITNADSAVISTTLTESVPDQYLGRVLAVYSFSGFSAGTIAPVIFGFLLDSAAAGRLPGLGAWASPWSWAFASLAIGSLVGLLAVGPLHRFRHRQNGLSTS